MKRSIIFGMMILYAILFLSKKIGWYFPELINSYLSDLLCIPIVLSISRYVVAYWINDARLKLNIWHITSAVFAFIIVFEIILPQKDPIYTSDPLDALMYLIGGVIFYFHQTKNLISFNIRSERIE